MSRTPPAHLERKPHPVRNALLVIIAAALLAGSGGGALSLYRQNRRLTAQNAQLQAEKGTLEREQGALRQEMADLQSQMHTLINQDHPAYQSLYPDLYVEGTPAGQVQQDTIFLTFDDGPSERTDDILALLEQEGIHATFFVVGPDTPARRERLQKIAAAGHTIGIHSYTHAYKTIYASVEDYLEDFYAVWSMVKEATGEAPTIFRFPGGSINGYNTGIYQDIIAEMLRRGFVYYDWNVSSGDATSKPLPAATIASNVCGSIGSHGRYIVLMHDSTPRKTTVDALPSIISDLKSRGYSFAGLTRDDLAVTFGYLSPVV